MIESSTYLEPKWALFLLEMALFWRVEAKKIEDVYRFQVCGLDAWNLMFSEIGESRVGIQKRTCLSNLVDFGKC